MTTLLSLERVQELLAGLMRVGRVSEVGGDGRVRVTFFDRDNLAPLLQVLHRRSGDNDMPALDDSVLCLMLPPDQIDGFVLGVIYDAKQGPPTDDPTVRVISGDDIRIGSVDAGHPVSRGDIVYRLISELFALLRTMVIPVPTGVAPLAGDVAGANAYGTGGLTAVLAAMETSDEGLAGLLNDAIQTE